MELSVMLGWVMTVLHSLSSYWYFLQLLRRESEVYISTRSIIALVSLISGLTYIQMTADPIKSIIPLVSMAANIVFLVPVMKYGRHKKLQKLDYVILAISLIAILIWLVFKNSSGANVIIQSSVLIAFIPQWIGISKGKPEKLLPWFVWLFTTSLHITVVLLRWQNHWQDLAAPVVWIVILTTVIVLRCRYLSKSSFSLKI